MNNIELIDKPFDIVSTLNVLIVLHKQRRKYVHSLVNQEHKHLDGAKVTIETPMDGNKYTLKQQITFPSEMSNKLSVKSNILNENLVILVKERFNSFSFTAFTYLNNLSFTQIDLYKPEHSKQGLISLSYNELSRFFLCTKKLSYFQALNHEKKLKYISKLGRKHRNT